ncbi:hypothetical protein [Rubinisphaera margarita]|uniref:hypothetical protein n=1 Tax=Rubinisphaera margarita TaxID=2909586 RepID=UPI001EE8DF4F|nr:hypothetical protein [Rubinisphaera margarita]MCG6157035.1 hypothetical protein [Rubinisphaera margarita]
MRVLSIVAALVFSLTVPAAAAQRTSFSIPEFVAVQDQWADLVGEPLRVEGRYSSFTPTAMRFLKCDLFFYLPSGTPRPLGRSKTLEVTGRLKRDQGELKFMVDSVQQRPADTDQLQISRALLPDNDAEPWYELGEKTVERADFYDDSLLKKLGIDLLERGLQIERSRRAEITPAFLKELSTKAARMGIPANRQQALQHEGLRLQLEQRKSTPTFDWASFREQVEKSLPGSIVPLTSLSGKLFDDYRRNPIETYVGASNHARQQLSRLFFLEVLQQEMTDRLSAGGANGDLLAKEYAMVAPDDPDFAQQLRDAALMYRSGNLLSATRTELLSLAQQYCDQGDAKMAEAAMRKWLDHRAGQLDRAGPSDYLQTAVDYDDWLDQRERAKEVLLRGIERYPGDTPLQGLLNKWGFIQQNDKWISSDDAPMVQPNEIELAIQAGRIVPGMKREHVVATIGAPKTVTRIASQSENLLIWNYPDVNLAVRFEQRRQRNDYEVVHVGPLP